MVSQFRKTSRGRAVLIAILLGLSCCVGLTDAIGVTDNEQDQNATVSTAAASAKQDQPKTRLVTLPGRVLDPAGRPVPDARVRVYGLDTNDLSTTRVPKLIPPENFGSTTVVTDADGRFEIVCSVPKERGILGVLVEKDGWAPAWTGWIHWNRKSVIFRSEAVGDLTLRRLGQVNGRVVDRDGKPVVGAEVFQSGNTHQRTTTSTDVEGEFQLTGFPDGGGFLFARKSGFRFQGTFFEQGDDIAQLTLTRTGEQAPAVRTLPPLLTAKQERALVRELAEPHWKKAVQADKAIDIFFASHWYAWIDPLAVLDHGKDYSLLKIAPGLHAHSPDDTFALIETAKGAQFKADIYLRLYLSVPVSEKQERLAILDRAMQHAAAVKEPDARLGFMSLIAARLFKLGDERQAATLVANLRSTSEQLADVESLGKFAEALALVDPQAVHGFIQKNEVGKSEEFLLRIAYRLADRLPNDASRLMRTRDAIIDANSSPLATGIKDASYRSPGSVAVCYQMAAADVDVALAVADRIRNPYLRAYARGLISLQVSDTDKKRAATLLAEAYDALEQAMSSKEIDLAVDRGMGNSASVMAAALLPAVEALDPSLVPEYVWRTLALRPRHSSSEAIYWMTDMGQTVTAGLVSRYDRRLARASLRPVTKRLVPKGYAINPWCLQGIGTTLALIDPSEGAQLIRGLPTLAGTLSSLLIFSLLAISLLQPEWRRCDEFRTATV